MNLKKIICCVLSFLCISVFRLSAQDCSSTNIQLQADISSNCTAMVMTMLHDKQNRSYLYVANKEAGLKIYNILIPTAPVLVKTIPITDYNGLEVMSIDQQGAYLYLALGNTFNNNQASGLAIVDVANPDIASVIDYWQLPSSKGGAGVVKVEGDYAYLGAMGNGLIILDVNNKNDIQFVSQFIPSINYPPISSPDQTKINARGMEVKNSIVYLCYDAGGFRIINCTNKSAPKETGRYCNPALYKPLNLPRAYNNLIVDDTIVYVAVDYCGVEVLNIKDTSNVKLIGWWNPYNCPNNNWFTSAVHANEIQYNKACKQLYIATGKSDLHVVDVANPKQPVSCAIYGGEANDLGTWGVGLYQNQIYLSYICVPWPYIPFKSTWTGVKVLTYTPCVAASVASGKEVSDVVAYPIPSQQTLTLDIEASKIDILRAKPTVSNILGEQFTVKYRSTEANKLILDISELGSGVYFINFDTSSGIKTVKFVKAVTDKME